MQYGNNVKPYVLAHLRPSASAQQAAALARPSLASALRPFADFYISHDLQKRQAALDILLQQLQPALQQQYGTMWDADAIAMFVVKVWLQALQQLQAYFCCVVL